MADMGDIGSGAAGMIGGVMLAGIGIAAAGAVIRSVENMGNSINQPATTRRRSTTRKVKRASPSGNMAVKMDRGMKKGKSKVDKMVFG